MAEGLKTSVTLELIDQMSSKVAAIKTAFSDLSATVQALNKSFGRVNVGFKRTAAALTHLDSGLKKIKESSKIVNHSFGKINAGVKHTTKAITSLGTGLSGLKGSIAPVASSVDTLNSQLSSATSTMSNNANQLANIKAHADAAKASMDGLNSSLNNTPALPPGGRGPGGGNPGGQHSNNAPGVSLSEVGGALSSAGSSLQSMGDQALGMAKSMADVCSTAVKEYLDLDYVTLNLRNALSKGAKGDADLKQLQAAAERLGTTLPGTTKDMANMFISLLKQGATAEDIVQKGLGRSVAEFAVLNNMTFEEAGTMVLKFGTALNTKNYGFVVDQITKLGGATSLDPYKLFETMKYLGTDAQGMLDIEKFKAKDPKNAEKLQQGATRDLLATVGLVSGGGVEGSMAGTNLARAISQLSKSKKTVESNKDLKKVLQKYGVSLKFFDDKGEFIGLRATIKELEKLNVMNDEDKTNALQNLLGAQGVRPMKTILRAGGVKALDKKREEMEAQISTREKIKALMESTTQELGLVEANLASLITEMGARIFEKFDVKKRIIQIKEALIEVVGWVRDPKNKKTIDLYLDRAKTIFKWLVGIGAVLSTLGTILVSMGGVIATFATFQTFFGLFASLPAILATIGGAVAPLLVALLALGAVGLAIYRYWEPLKTFFSGFWDGIQAGWEAIQPDLDYCKEKFREILEMVAPFESSINQVEAGGTAGFLVVKAFGTLLADTAAIIKTVIEYLGYFGAACGYAYFELDEKIKAGVAWIKNAFRSVRDKAIELLKELLAFIFGKIGDIQEKIKTSVAWIKNKFSSLIGSFKSIGSSIIDSFISGLQSGWQRITSMADSLKNLFHISAKVDLPTAPTPMTYEEANAKDAAVRASAPNGSNGTSGSSSKGSSASAGSVATTNNTYYDDHRAISVAIYSTKDAEDAAFRLGFGV